MDIISKKISLPISLHYDLKIPEGNTSVPMLIALHGYGENKEMMMTVLKNNLDFPCIIASLQAPFPHIVTPVWPGRQIKYGFGWITSFDPDEAIGLHHQAIDQIIEDVNLNRNTDISKTILLGFSQSVALNFRYVFSKPDKIDRLIAICGGLPGDWGQEDKYRFSKTDVLYIGCKKDIIYPPKTIMENSEKLKPKCRSINFVIYEDTHRIPPECFKEINLFCNKNETVP